ncbi:hypothetical protein VSS74_31555, partial [Conexibacter stalactiti]
RTDYNHYYAGTWVVLKENNVNVPLFVLEVSDPSNRREHDYSEEHRAQLLLVCDRYDKDRSGRLRSSRCEVNVMNENLVLESPDVGYVKTGDVVRWTHITPVRQRMKGVTGHKIRQVQVGQRQGQLMYDLFNPEFEGLIDRYTYVAPFNNQIYYKGAHIGRVNHDTRSVILLRRFQYLVETVLQPEFPVYVFDLVGNL